MTYQQTLEWLFAQLPMYQRVGGANYKIDLEKTLKLMQLLGNPENKFPSIHVAGTNGKGSTSHLIASALQEKGLKVGLYTSPHLKDFRERIKINGELISEPEVVNFVQKYQNEFLQLELSFFEMTVGLGFDYFVKQKVDIAVIEVGMGGRLDSTNVIHPLVSVITNISFDHKQFLGDTLEKIAGEKAGIIKKGVTVVIGKTQIETEPVFVKIAREKGAYICFADQQKRIEIDSDLKGFYQRENKQTAYYALKTLPEKFQPSEDHIKNGFKKVVANTHLLGRWQQLGSNPLIICDTGHNEDGIRWVLSQINSITCERLHIVWGMVNDKELEPILSLLPQQAVYYFTQPNLPRALPARTLQVEAEKFGLQGKIYESVPSALKVAKNAAGKNDFIFVGGSTFVVAEVV